MNLRAFSIANLATHQILQEHREPWATASAVPDFPTREAYQKWMASPDTVAPLFSLVEGSNPGVRVSSSNPAYRVHGIVADYDAPLQNEAEYGAGATRCVAPIYAHNRTRRGGVRLVFAFERPVFFYGIDTFKRLMLRARKELRLESLFPGLDSELLTDPDHTYVAGDKWTVVGHHLAHETVGLWLFDALKKSADFKEGLEIPLELIEKEVHKKFPGRWNGAFNEGSRGLRFWAPEADNPTAAIVRKTGMTAFTGDRPFLSWGDIFGHAFVQKYQEDRIGRAVTEMYCDPEKHYYRALPDGTWDACDATVARRHLKIRYQLSDKGDPSEIDMVLHNLECNNRVVGAVPFPHRPEKIVDWNGDRYLNTATTIRLMQPLPTSADWPEGFPYVADYLMTLFHDHQNLEVFLSWLKVWYTSCRSGRPAKGHALFIAGPPGTGKSLLSLELLATIFGGYSNAQKFFVEDSKYNSKAYEKALWSLDDQTILGDRKKHQKFSGLVKACVANPSFPYEKKYGMAGEAPFEGRFVVTLNEDPVSLGILPDTDLSLLDKVILLRTGEFPAVTVGSARENHDRIEAELPAFLSWLCAWEIPEWVERDERFGIKSWHDRVILTEAQASSETASVLDAIQLWATGTNAEGKTAIDFPWKGKTSQLLAVLKDSTSPARTLIQNQNMITFGRLLNAAMTAHAPEWIERKRYTKQTFYVINKKVLEA